MKDINICIFEQHARDCDAWVEEHAYAYQLEVMAVRRSSSHEAAES
jgi:hypothetical protein